MTTLEKAKKEYPRVQDFDGRKLSFRLMTPEDEKAMKMAVLKFTRALPDDDIVFLRMDITQPEVVDEWVENVRLGRTVTVLVEENDNVEGYGNLHLSELQWTGHIGELRILVSESLRGHGVGRALVEQLTELARLQGLEKVVAQIPSTQPKVRKMFEGLGFEPSAFLTDWLKDRNHKLHDLILMSRDILA